MLIASTLTGACAAAPAEPRDAAESASLTGPAKMIGVRFGGDASSTRLVIDLSAPVAARVHMALDGASRATVSLPLVQAGEASEGRGRGAIKGWRRADGEDGVRLVLDLADGARLAHHFLLPPSASGQPYRLVVDVVVASGEPSAGGVVASPRVAPAVVQADRLRVSRRVKVIVVDAGHGGHDPGAQSTDHNEKDVTLAAALTLKKRLELSGRYKVVLTRAGDVFIPLEERVRIARKAGADLFISLHADSAGPDPGTHGASIYTLSDHGETRVHTVLGQNEWFNRAGKRSDPAVGQILLDLTQNNTRNRSSEFAGLLLQHLSDRVDLLPRTRRDAGYFVLLAPDVPAVLLEMGFISNPSDEARLTDTAQRRRLMDGVAEAIDSYFVTPTQVASGGEVATP